MIIIPDTAPKSNNLWSPEERIRVSQQTMSHTPKAAVSLRCVQNVESKTYPPPSERKHKVKHLEKKLEIDWERKFDGLGGPQREALIKLIDKNAELRKRVNLEPGICEKLSDPLYETSKTTESTLNSLEQISPQITIMVDSDDHPRENVQSEPLNDYDLQSLEYPLQEYKIVGGVSSEFGSSDNMLWSRKNSENDQGRNLKQLYGKFIENKIIKQSSNNDLELEAIAAMKMVSADLQSWIVDVLDNSILMDPEIIQQVNEMDEKAGVDPQKQKGPPIPEIDISGFNVLLNACKPAILEARPPMKLNVVKEMGRMGTIIQDKKSSNHDNNDTDSNTKRRAQYGAWYLPINQWTIKKKENESDQYAKRGHVFGGIVQQKLDDITKKRETDMKALMKENGEGLDSTKSRKKRHK